MTKILKNKRVFAEEGGISTSDAARIITLENNELKITYFTVVSGTSGTIIPPTQATFNSDEFGLSGNALLSEIDINGKPTFQSPTDIFGTPVTATLDVSTGDWLASGIYTSTSVALIYSLNIKTIYYSNLNYFNIIESESVGGHAVSLINTFGLITGGPITSSGTISTAMKENRLVGRGSTSGPGEMEEIIIGAGLALSGNILDSTVPQLGYYGAWQTDTTQTAAADNTGYAMKFTIADITPNGISIANNGSGNPTRITFANTGIYNLQFSAQLQSLSVSAEDVTIWLRMNGSDVAGSAGIVGMGARKSAGDPFHIIAAWNYVLSVVAGQYYELVWSTSNHTDVEMRFYAAGSPPPSAASVILTVTQQSGIMAGTGVTAINGATDSVQTLTTGTTGTDFAIVESGGDHKFNLPDASATARGVVTTNSQTFAGQKTMTSPIFLTDITTPLIYGSNGTLSHSNAVQTSGASSAFVFTNPANTNQTLSTEVSGFKINSGTRQWATGAITTQRENLISAPTFSFVGASTITSAATLAVTAAPIAGTNATITNAYSIWSQSGAVRVNDGTGSLTFRQLVGTAADPTLYMFNDQTTAPSATNYILKVGSANSGATFLNSSTGVIISTNGVSRISVQNGSNVQSNIQTASGALTSFPFNPSSNTNQTASTEQKSFDVATCTSQHATGALTTQRFAVFNAPTYSFVGASTITNAATLAVTAAPIAGTNATITNSYALWVQGGKSLFAGNIELTQTVTTESLTSNRSVTIVINGTTYKLLAVL